MYACWSRSAGRRMLTTDGRSVLVIYPGIRSDSRGPDYKSAVVSFDSGALTSGDIELHMDSRDWHRHGHDADPAYDNVVLQVVGHDTGVHDASTSCAARVPVAVLSGPVWLPGMSPLPCVFAPDNEGEVRQVLARAGLVRLFVRARALVRRCSEEGQWQVLAARLTRALGYSANAETAESLGRLLAETHLHAMLLRCDEEQRSAFVLGVAGLLPSQRRGTGLTVVGDAPDYEAHWQAVEAGVPALDSREWRLNGLYPNNSPVRRVAALADLWPRMEELEQRVVQAVSNLAYEPRSCARELERMIHVRGGAYWRAHSDFGILTGESDVIGSGKAREIVINAVLPFVTALAMRHRDHSLLQAVVQLYAGYPPAPKNTVTRHMRRQCGLQHIHTTADIEQGLLHLFYTYCRHGRCPECPLAGC